MGNYRKVSSLALLLLLAATSLYGVNSVSAQSIPKPSIPEFSIVEVSHPYDVASTTYTDPHSGKTIIHPGYHVENRTIELKIKNQPFVHQLSNGSQVSLYYQIRFKGHYEESNWYHQFGAPNTYPKASESDYTFVPLHLYSPGSSGFQDGDKWDIEVQALIGSVEFVNGRLWGFGDYYVFNGVSGDWSDSQTLTINLAKATSTLSPTEFSSQDQTAATNHSEGIPSVFPLDFYWIEIGAFAALGVVVALLIVVIALMRRRIKVLELKHNGAQ